MRSFVSIGSPVHGTVNATFREALVHIYSEVDDNVILEKFARLPAMKQCVEMMVEHSGLL